MGALFGGGPSAPDNSAAIAAQNAQLAKQQAEADAQAQTLKDQQESALNDQARKKTGLASLLSGSGAGYGDNVSSTLG